MASVGFGTIGGHLRWILDISLSIAAKEGMIAGHLSTSLVCMGFLFIAAAP